METSRGSRAQRSAACRRHNAAAGAAVWLIVLLTLVTSWLPGVWSGTLHGT